MTSNPGVISSGKSRDGSGTATVRNIFGLDQAQISCPAAVEPGAVEREFLKEALLVRGDADPCPSSARRPATKVPIQANSPSSSRAGEFGRDPAGGGGNMGWDGSKCQSS